MLRSSRETDILPGVLNRCVSLGSMLREHGYVIGFNLSITNCQPFSSVNMVAKVWKFENALKYQSQIEWGL